MTHERALELLIEEKEKTIRLRHALKELLNYIDAGKDSSAQPCHPAHFARQLLSS
jgi:hypothetical protein